MNHLRRKNNNTINYTINTFTIDQVRSLNENADIDRMYLLYFY